MKVLLQKTKDILNSSLSMSQRGLLITILLVRDKEDPKVTLAILKAKVKLSEHKEDLIYLHENSFIEWSEYNKAKKSLVKKELSPDIIDAVSFMNSLYGRNFDINSDSTTKNLTARINQYGIDKVMQVIANRWEEWKDNDKMKKYLKPSTIFRSSKFDKYLEEVMSTGRGLKYISIDEMNIKDGDELTSINVVELRDDDVYTIKAYPIFKDSNVQAAGIEQKSYGKDIKFLVATQDRKETNGKSREFKYIFINE